MGDNYIKVLVKTRRFSVLSRPQNSLYNVSCEALYTIDPFHKAQMTLEFCELWKSGQIVLKDNHSSSSNGPAQPSRRFSVKERDLRNPLKSMMKKNTSTYTIHGIANAELFAIDLFWDLIARWLSAIEMPRQFYDDLMYIVEQEAQHYFSWASRLENLGFQFGCFPCPDGLWQDALNTQDDILARLTVINLTQEARGLDTYPKTKEKFIAANDESSAALLEHNYLQEIQHVAIGLKWFQYICEHRSLPSIATFHELSGRYYRGKLKPPFNIEARTAAGMSEDWYMPIADTSSSVYK